MTPTYATQSDFAAYVEGWTTDNGAALDRLLERAEVDIDGLAATVVPADPDAVARRFDVTALSARDRDVLKRATCAQAEYRFNMGEAFFVKGQYEQVTGPDFATTGRLPWIGPKVYRELAGTDLIPLSFAAGPTHPSRPPWYSFAYNDPSEV
jgi:hypothetical protein